MKNNKKYYFVLQQKEFEDGNKIHDIFTFDNKEDMQEWKERNMKFHIKHDADVNVSYIYTSYLPETWDIFELKSEDWGI